MRPEDKVSQAEAKLVADVKAYGWHVLNVFSNEGRPNFSYSVGMQTTLGHPDLAVFGLSLEVGQSLINLVGDAIRSGLWLTDGARSSDFLQAYDCLFRAVPPYLHPEYFGWGLWFYGDEEFSVLQLIYPDRFGQWPWEEGVDQAFRDAQPVLAERQAP
jgi:hypothetical protein